MLEREIIIADGAPKALGPYSHGVKAGDFIFTAGQIGLDPETNKLVDGVKAQTTRSLENLQIILKSVGSSLDRSVKVTVFVSDLSNFSLVNEVYKEFFVGECPGRSCVEVSNLPAGALVEIEVVALA